MPFPHNDKFVGRVKELRQTHEYFSKPNLTDSPRVFALVGTGGMGKTQIALEYAYCHHRNYTAIFWVSAASEDTIRTSFVNIMQCIVEEQAKIALPEPPDYQAIGLKLGIPGLIDGKSGTVSTDLKAADNIRSALFSWLQLPRNSRWLLIFDNADDIETSKIQEYFPNHGGGAILITSRRRGFAQAWEHVDLDGLDREDAVKLLLNLAHLTSTSEGSYNETYNSHQQLANCSIM